MHNLLTAAIFDRIKFILARVWSVGAGAEIQLNDIEQTPALVIFHPGDCEGAICEKRPQF